jgi:predicted phosphodiesterase
MKKYLVIIGIILVVLATSVFGYSFLAAHKTVPASATSTADNQAPSRTSSFQGVVAGVAENLGDKVAEITEPSSAVPTPAPSAQSTGTENGASFSFAVFGDTKEFKASDPSGNLEKAVARTKDQNLAAFFMMGDLIKSCDGGNSCTQKFNEWKSVMAPILSKTYEVVGNHDRTGGDKADLVWQKEFSLPQNGPEGYKDLVYSFDVGNSHFVVLDSEKPKEHIVNSIQRDWLEKDLAATNKEHKFVFYHEPAFQAAQDAEDGLDSDPAERDALWNIIKRYKVDVVFNGHAHIYARKNVGGVEQIVVGDTDSTNDDIVQPGLSDFGYKGKSYAIVTVDGSKISLKLFTVDGKQVDSFDFK